MSAAPQPESFGRYRVTGRIAAGGMAEIYCAYDPLLEREVAVKVLGPDQQTDAAVSERFRLEAQAIAGLRHPNIVQVYDVGEAHGGRYTIMEFVRGCSLAERLAELRAAGRRMPREEALTILAQVAAALDYAHACGVVHRDVKPGNILLRGGASDDVVLADFGLARLLDQSADSTTGRSFGTPEYIAPEQALRSSAATPRSDVYSLGVVAYLLISGELPFGGDSPLAVALQHLNDAPPSLRELDGALGPAVDATVLRALAKDPAARYASAGDFVADLREALLQPAAAAPAVAPAVEPAAAPAPAAVRGPAADPTEAFTRPEPPIIWPDIGVETGDPRAPRPVPATAPPAAEPPASSPAEPPVEPPVEPLGEPPVVIVRRPRVRLSLTRLALVALPLLALFACAAIAAGWALQSGLLTGVLPALPAFSGGVPALLPAGDTPVPDAGRGAPIAGASLAGQEVLQPGDGSFVARLTFALEAQQLAGLYGELNGVNYYPVACDAGSCSFDVTVDCAATSGLRMTFHSGIYWRYTTFNVERPPACGD